MERVRLTEFKEFKDRISWGSIIAGVMTVLAISVLLSILTTSISLFMFDPTDKDPVHGIGTTVGIWSGISFLLSLAAGGFVAGKLAGRDGIIHGFLVWATTLIVAVILGVMLAKALVKTTANILGSVASVTGNVIAGAGSLVGDGVSEIGDFAGNLLEGTDWNDKIDDQNIRQDVRQALRKSGVKEFQPEYLNQQLKAVKTDLGNTAKKILLRPMEAESILNSFGDRLQARADTFANNVDREDVVKAIANNTHQTRAEAERTADEYIELYNQAVQQGKEQIENLQHTIADAKVEMEQMKQKALQATEDAANAAGRSALISFFAALIGAVLCAFCGRYGTMQTWERKEI